MGCGIHLILTSRGNVILTCVCSGLVPDNVQRGTAHKIGLKFGGGGGGVRVEI